jgi:hypothetical protein
LLLFEVEALRSLSEHLPEGPLLKLPEALLVLRLREHVRVDRERDRRACVPEHAGAT